MPIEIVELGKLVVAILLFIVPGYLWSFLFFKPKTTKMRNTNPFVKNKSTHETPTSITRLERIIFGFILTMSMFILIFFIMDLILNIPITRTKTLIIYSVYSIPILAIIIIKIIRNEITDQTKKFFSHIKKISKQPIDHIKTNKTIQILLLLTAILAFAMFMGFLPHLKENYYLPFHVDEWIHWTDSKSFMEAGSSAFVNPFLGTGTIRPLEPGFHYFISTLAWLSGVNFNTIFIFTPAIVMALSSITVFNFGNKHRMPFGLEAAFFITFIPTTCRMLGPSFFVPLSLGLFFLIFLLWFLQQKINFFMSLLVPLGLWVIFIIHPPTALAAIIITFLYATMVLFEKKFKKSILYFVYSFVLVSGVFAISTRYQRSINQLIDAFFGGKYFFDYNLPKIWVSFEQIGIIVWIFSFIGIYFAFSKGKSIIRTIAMSALIFISLIGLYDKIGYGLPIIYERSFMYLFLMICLLAGWGFAELRRTISKLLQNFPQLFKEKIHFKFIRKQSVNIITVFVAIMLMILAVPIHSNIPYYHMIDENDYDTFYWIEQNIEKFRNNSNQYERAAVDPFKASPFSAITRLYIVSSTMHPIHGYNYHNEISDFLSGGCEDTAVLDDFDISIIYASYCSNDDLVCINDNVYLYKN